MGIGSVCISSRERQIELSWSVLDRGLFRFFAVS